MKPINPTTTHPFPFLLYLEWLLLILCVLLEFLPTPTKHLPKIPLLNILIIIGFGVMGLRLPKVSQIGKILYTALEIILILIAGLSENLRFFLFLYLILVIRGCLIFQLSGRLIVTGVVFLLFLLTLILRFETTDFPNRLLEEREKFFILNSTLLFGLVLLFVLLLVNALLAERKSREKLANANEQLRQYTLRIEDQATLQERNRIARDIHDSLGHSLTALNLQLETAVKLWSVDSTKAHSFLTEAKRLGSQALQDVRWSVSALRFDPLQGRSLETAIASLAEEFHRTTGILPNLYFHLPNSIPSEFPTAIYRIVQEALTNICKYALASEVKIQLLSSATELTLIIQDNGQGFNQDKNTTGFGLQSMRDRTLALGGQFHLKTAPNAGCEIAVSFRLPKNWN